MTHPHCNIYCHLKVTAQLFSCLSKNVIIGRQCACVGLFPSMCLTMHVDLIECNPLLFACALSFLFMVYLWVGRVDVAPGWAGGRPLVEWKTGGLWFPGRQRGGSKGQSSEGTASRAWDEEAGLVRAGSKLIGPPWHCWGLYVCVFVFCVCGGMCVCVCRCMCGEGEGGDVVQIKDSALTWYALALLGKKERDKTGEKYG